MITQSLKELEQIHFYGRTTFDLDAVNLFWSGSGLDFLFDGSDLSFCYEADYDRIEPWISVLVDGSWILRMPAQKGKHAVSVLHGTAAGTAHRIQILKDTQAMAEDPAHWLAIRSITYDGKIMKPPAFDLKLEVIGDSITSGEGCIGALWEDDWITAFFTSVPTYGRLMAEKLNADYRILSQSGWGVRSSWDNNIHNALPNCYEYLCSLSGDRSAAVKNDFSVWNADVVVVNLGTNDAASFDNPAFFEPATGKTYKNRRLSNGQYHAEDLENIIEAQKDFLKKIRKNNPDAIIIWCYGMLGYDISPALKKGVEEFCEENADTKAFYLELPEMTEKTVGSRKHPGIQCHQETAQVLTDFIKNKLQFRNNESVCRRK